MKKQVSPLGFLAVMSMFLISMGVTVTTPAMAIIAAQFPENNYALVSTLPTLFVVPASLVCGSILGKQLKYRICGIAGSVIFLFGGILPVGNTNKKARHSQNDRHYQCDDSRHVFNSSKIKYTLRCSCGERRVSLDSVFIRNKRDSLSR